MASQFKNYWHQFPLLWIAISLGCGIFSAQFIPLIYAEYYYASLLFAGFLSGFLLTASNTTFRVRVKGVLLLCFAFFIGIAAYQAKSWLDTKKLLPSQGAMMLQGSIIQKFAKSSRPRYLISVDYAGMTSDLKKHSAQVIVTFDKKDTTSQRYVEGDQILFYGIPQLIEATTNPLAFDYRQHLSEKSIFQQINVKNGHHKKASNTIEPSIVVSKLRQIKNHSISVLDKYITDPESKGIAMALILGHVDLISDDTYKGFADAGAIHVLSVSGLHVMVFIGVFLWLSEKIRTSSLWSKVAKVTLLIFLTLFYVVLTGMAPSIVRSGVMVSLYLVGKYVLKRQNSYNILALAAIAMLLYNPKYLFQISFQFSFLALLSILYFYPVFKQWYTPRYRIDKYIWELGIVGVAAQILVLPFSLYYFHKFPTYFFLSGIIAVPLSSLVIYGGFLLIIFDFMVGSLIYPLGFAMNYLLQCLNLIIIKISKLPFAVIEGLYVDNLLLVLLILTVVSLIIYLSYWTKNALYAFLCGFIISVSWVQWTRMDAFYNNEIQVYDMKKGVLVDIFTRGQLFTYISPSIATKSVDFAASNNRAAHYILSTPQRLPSGLLTLDKRNFWFIDTISTSRVVPTFEAMDAIVVNANIPPPTKIIKTAVLILGNAVKPYNLAKWKAYVDHNPKTKMHILSIDGATCLNF